MADAEGEKHEAAEYHAVVCFDRLAEITALYCTKGRRVYIEGKLRTRQYEGTDGARRSVTEIVAQALKLLQPARREAEVVEERA